MLKIKKQENNSLSFSLLSGQGTSLFDSIPYASKDQLHHAFLKMKNPKDNEVIYERNTDHQGNFVFYVKDSQGLLLGQSQLYRSEAGMENGIKNLRNRLSVVKL